MTISDGLMIFAVIIAPVLAVQAQKFIEKITEKKELKKKVFSTLMTTRATPLSKEHVEALNQIDIAFYDNKKIINIWKDMMDNYYNYPKDINSSTYEADLSTKCQKTEDLRADLLDEIAKDLNYSFDKTSLKRGAYFPQAHGEIENDSYLLRKNLVEITSGRKSIPVKIEDNQENNQTI